MTIEQFRQIYDEWKNSGLSVQQYCVLISLYRYQVYHCNRYHASAAIGTACIAANGTKFIGSA